MKYLFDPILSGHPHKCSSAFKYAEIAKRLLVQDPHAFIYWPVPTWVNEEGRNWLPKDPRIQYFDVFSYKDRVREYLRFPEWLEDACFNNGTHWDCDFIITMRTAQVPNMALNKSPYRDNRQHVLSRIILLEEMALLTSRMTVFANHPVATDLATVNGHYMADRSYITAQHVRNQVISAAMNFLPPSRVRDLDKRLHLVRPLTLSQFETFSDKKIKAKKKPLKATFVGRMNRSMSQFELSSKSTEYEWIMNGAEGIEYKASTVSDAIKDNPLHCEIRQNNREQFWAMLRDETDVVLYLAVDGEFSLSMIEPMGLGVPVLLNRTAQSMGLVGKEYPFFVTNKESILGYLKAFRDDYATQYAKFVQWRDTTFLHRLTEGEYKDELYSHVLEGIARDRIDIFTELTRFQPKDVSEKKSDFLREYDKLLAASDEIMLPDVLGTIPGAEGIKDKMAPDDWRTRSMSFQTPWQPLRLRAMLYHGYVDASHKTGHMKKVPA